MEPFEELVRHLRDALTHLYDPAYHSPDTLWEVTGCAPWQGVEAVQAALIEAIEALKPAAGVPPTARVRRVYQLLSCRYVQGLTQKKTAERLGITPRHLRREQREAIHTLAGRLWEQSRLRATSAETRESTREEGTRRSLATLPDAQSAGWRSQVREELAFLQESTPDAVTDVGGTVRDVVKLESDLVSKRDVRLEIERMQPGLYAAIHPTALRQVLIVAIGKIVQGMSCGRITLSAQEDEESITVDIRGCPAAAGAVPESDLVREILAARGGAFEIGGEGNCVLWQIRLPSADKVTVLVVDDNKDLVHFYGRYTTGTRYNITSTLRGQDVFEMIEAVSPDIIVLDVMLPDIDGWELLMRLYEDPETRSIPVVVCSVVREEELALSLGAALYLPKPVRRRSFIAALDQALSRGST